MQTTNRHVFQLFHWLSTVAMIFFILLVVFQTELQSHHLTKEDTATINDSNNQEYFFPDYIDPQKCDMMSVVRKKINRNHMNGQSDETLNIIPSPSDMNFFFEELSEVMFEENFSPMLFGQQLIVKKKKKPKTAFDGIIISASESHQVDADLIRAIIKAESNYNPKAVSRVGAQGLMQLMPETAKYLGVKNSFEPLANRP